MRTFLFLFCLLLSASASVAAGCGGRLIEGADIINGPICIPDEPARIVVLDPTYSLGMSLELDMPVVGAPLFGMSDEALKTRAQARGVRDLGSFAEPSLETIIALRPDLIIGPGLAGGSVQRMMSRIAPTLIIDAENWKGYYRRIAEIGGREEQLEQALSAYEARVAALRDRMPDETVSVVRITPWDFQVYLDAPDAYGPFLVMREVGVRRTDYETFDGGVRMRRPDWEELAGLDGDILLYIVGGANDSATSGRHEEVLANPLWKLLPAVRAGRVHRVDAATWMEFSGLASAHRVLDDIARYIVDRP